MPYASISARILDAMAQHRVEVHLDCQGFLARTDSGARFNSGGIQPHYGPV